MRRSSARVAPSEKQVERLRIHGHGQTWGAHSRQEPSCLGGDGPGCHEDQPVRCSGAAHGQIRPEQRVRQMAAAYVAEDHVVRTDRTVDPIDPVQRIRRDLDVVRREHGAEPAREACRVSSINRIRRCRTIAAPVQSSYRPRERPSASQSDRAPAHCLRGSAAIAAPLSARRLQILRRMMVHTLRRPRPVNIEPVASSR